MPNHPRPSSDERTPEIEQRERLRALLDRLMHTRAEPQRQALLAQVRSEIQEIRKLVDF